MLRYLSLDIICSSKLTVFLELRSRKTVCFSEQITSADKYLSIFSRQMEAIVYIVIVIIIQDSANKGLVQEIVFLVFHRCLYNKQNITCPLVDTNFIFECSTRYLTSERSERVRYRVEHEKIKFVSTRGHVISSIY